MPDSIITTPVVVPPRFVGLSTGNIVAAPANVRHDVVRSWDYNGTNGYLTGTCVMTFINPSAGVYNWSTFDQLLGNNPTKQIIITLGATPDYLVSRAATGSSYKGTKGNMCPDNLDGWATAVQALVERARTTFGRTGLMWQMWNEIDQVASYNDSIALLGPYTRVTCQAIRAIDPTAILLGPTIAGGTTDKVPFSASYITAADGVGGRAMDWLDGVCVHYYNQVLAQLPQFENPINFTNLYRNFQGAMANAGCHLPIYMTETGVIAADPNGWRAYQRRLLTAAALGAKLCLAYQYDSSLYPMTSYVSQWNDVAERLSAGSVISGCWLGMAKLQIAINGVTYTY